MARVAIEAEPATGPTRTPPPPRRPDMSWTDHLVMLLHIAAEIEHGLMVQYLYAGWSLGGPQVPEAHRATVRAWRDSILAIAKEEMGHLLTVQNALTLLGAPTNLARRDFPWDSRYYPFDFALEPFSGSSLSCYLYAEMPDEAAFAPPPGRKMDARYRRFLENERTAVIAFTKEAAGGRPHQVGTVYDDIIALLGDRIRIPDTIFRGETYAHQAGWDDWGRNYAAEPYGLDSEGNRLPADDPLNPPAASRRLPLVLIDRMATRTQALDALRALSAQGEALHLGQHETGEPSHFDRFLEIYQQAEPLSYEAWSPALPLARNPTTIEGDGGNSGDYLADPGSRALGELFNLRYRLLLTWLAFSFRLARTAEPGRPSRRAMAMHRVFGEMYQLKAIAGLLTARPAAPDGKRRAGPPFEMPYQLDLPPEDRDVWRLLSSLLDAAQAQAATSAALAPEAGPYLKTLAALDQDACRFVGAILHGGR